MFDHNLPYRSLYTGFQASAARSADLIAIRDAGRNTSYRQLEAASREAARALIGLGMARGDAVAIWAVNHSDWVIAGLAIQAASGTLIPASTRLKAREIGNILRRVGARYLFCDPGFGSEDFVAAILSEDLPALQHVVVFGDGPGTGRVLGWEAFLRHAATVASETLDARIAETGPDDIADIIFTSGTTGLPKGVPMTNGQSLIACEQQQLCYSHYRYGDTFAVTYPFAHNAGYRAGWQASLLFGITLVPVRNYDATAFLEMIERDRVTILPAVPTIHQAILDHPERRNYDLSSLRLAATGATSIPVKLIEQMQAIYGPDAVFTGYGLTETAGSVSTTRPGDNALVIATTTGRPLDNLSVKLLDADHNDVPQGEQGEIAVKGPQVMRGYYQDDLATRAAFTGDGYLLTGDVGVFDAAGNLAITDRIKDMYIVGGFNTYPAEIEQQLRLIDGVADAAVIGVADERLGEVGRAFIIRRAGSHLDEATVIAWCRSNMANYKVPRSVIFVDALPLNPTGKVSKIELRKVA